MDEKGTAAKTQTQSGDIQEVEALGMNIGMLSEHAEMQ